MLRKRSQKVVITFETTTQAMKMEGCAKKEHVAGRLIPIPTEISAGCGMAWCAEAEHKQMLEQFVKEQHVEVEKVYELFL